MKSCDVLISGTGIAGLSLAIQLMEKKPELKIILLTKNEPEESNTSLAQGGIAAVCDRLVDSFEEHIQDTLNAGQGKCNPTIVEMVVKQGPQRLNELIRWGAEFDTENDGQLAMALEGGHSRSRVVHHKDKTGWHIQKVLWDKIIASPQVEVIAHAFGIDLITQVLEDEITVIGLNYLPKENTQIKQVFASTVVLATGGCGQLFQYTSNPSIATADGVAMAFRAGATIKEMQYIQFHPTALYEKNKSNLFLISEAIRGYGGYVVNQKGERFLFQYDSRGELATRDIVSHAILDHLKLTQDSCAFLDLRHLNQADFKIQFPTIYAQILQTNLNPALHLIPIIPAAHYQCGGIEVDQNGLTSLSNLYALGECSSTGLHGANRLASNSLLEALVFAFNAANEIVKRQLPPLEPLILKASRVFEPHEIIESAVINVFKNKVKSMMNYQTLHASKEEKLAIIEQLTKIHFDLIECVEYYFRCRNCIELENMLQTALIIMKHALSENELSSFNSNFNTVLS